MITEKKPVSSCLLFALALVLPTSLCAIDPETPPDGLGDVWEAFFGAQLLLPFEDDDDDGRTNIEESDAGTDPFDASDHLSIKIFEVQAQSGSAERMVKVSISTVEGKEYQIQASDSLEAFEDIGPVIDGTGGEVTVVLSSDEATSVSGGVTQDVYVGTGGSTIASLSSHPGFPNSPAATHTLGKLETPRNADTNYGGRMRGFITPPGTGDFTFYLASNADSELWINTGFDPSTNDPVDPTAPAYKRKIAFVEGDSVAPGEWTAVASQTSVPINLDENRKYYVEVLHIHKTGEDHCSVGWQGPGVSAGIQVVSGANLDSSLSEGEAITELAGLDRQFFSVSVMDRDSDADGVSDWAEIQMRSFSPYRDNSNGSGLSDLVTLQNSLTETTDTVELVVIDGEAYEKNAPDPGKDSGKLEVRRTVSTLEPIAVAVSLGGAVQAGEEKAEPGDYSAIDGDGNPVTPGTNVILLGFGEMSNSITIDAVDDSSMEFPEVVTAELQPGESYTLGNRLAGVKIMDRRDLPENRTMFAGFFQKDFKAETETSASGVASLVLNGPNDHATLTTSFTGLTSDQFDAHIHRANPGPAGGVIVYEITNVPGVEESNPKVGPLEGYPWEIEPAAGHTKQDLIDSLFGQNGAPPLYINKHTDNNPAGEIMAIFTEVDGSIEFSPPADPAAIEFLSDMDDVYLDTHRFFEQATFGPQGELVNDGQGGWNFESDVTRMVEKIQNRRTPGHPDFISESYSRIAAFDEWINEQFNQQQSYLVDFTLAADMFEWYLKGYFDPQNYPAEIDPDTGETVPTDDFPGVPGVDGKAPFPGVDHNHSMSAWWKPGSPTVTGWKPTADYPLLKAQRNKFGLGDLDHRNRVSGNWTLFANAKDQLRQRCAFSWSQIMVVSDQEADIRNYRMGLADYHDSLAKNSFGNFRDLLEDVTWHPVMSSWLSSLKNQKEVIDDNGTPNNPDDDVILSSPDENYAREIKQLFSLGLIKLHPDGTAALDPNSGLIQETYDNDDIQEMAKVFTGFSFGIKSNTAEEYDELIDNNSFNEGNGNKDLGHLWNYKVRMFGDRHDPGVKHIVGGVTIDNTGTNNLTKRAVKDVAHVHDWLAGSGAAPYDGHPNTPPFLVLRLIQRQVKSTPTNGYIYRVAEAFRQHGGDLKETVRAMLLDYEARSLEMLDDPGHGKKKAPIMAYLQLIRALQFQPDYRVNDLNDYGFATSQSDNLSPGRIYRYDFTDTDPKNANLSMRWYGAETVFNFWDFNYAPSFLAEKFLVGPEFQIATESNMYRNANYIENLAHDNQQDVQGFPNKNNLRDDMGYDKNSDRIEMHNQKGKWVLGYFYPDSNEDEWKRDRDMIDELDRILLGGFLKRKYPVLDPANRTPASGDSVVSDSDRNPREILIDAITDSYDTGENDRHNKFKLALWLMTTGSQFLTQQ